jgi:CHAT domain-containing protein/tetratricopeptide (TPR) repeat protein
MCAVQFSAITTLTGTTLKAYADQESAADSSMATPMQESGSAENSTQKLLTLPETPEKTQTIEKVDEFETQAERLFDSQQFGQALVKWQAAYGASLEIGYSDGIGRALTGMCLLYLTRGQVVKAKELGENALDVLGNSTDKLALGKARVAVAQAYFALDNPTGAGQQLELALKTFTQLGDKDAINTAHVMQLIASVLVKQEKIKEAIPFFQGAATFYGQAGNHFEEMSIRTSLVTLLSQMGLSMASLEEAQKAVAEARATKEPGYISSALMVLGNAQYNLCEFAAARKSFEEALATQPPSKQPISKANLYTAYGSALAATGDTEQALKFLNQAYVVMRQKAPVLSQVQLLNTLGVVEEQLNDHGSASKYLELALELQTTASVKRDKLNIVILQNIAIAESHSGRGRLAVSHLQNALDIAKNSKLSLLAGRIQTSLAELLFAQKDFDAAKQNLQEGIVISESLNDDAALWQDYALLAEIQRAEQAPQSAINDSLKSALSYFRSPQAAYFSSAEELGYVNSRADTAHLLMSQLISSGMTESAYLVENQLKEEFLANEWTKRGGTVKAEDVEIYSDLTSQKAHLHAAEAGTTPDKLVTDWKSWIQRYQRLATENRELARLIAPAPLNYDAVRKTVISNKLMLVDYYVESNETFVFTIDPKGDITVHSLPIGAKDLESQISDLTSLQSGASSSSELQSVSKKKLQLLCGELFPAELTRLLPSSPDQVIAIIPDGALFNLPFAALVMPDGKFLVQDHTITTAPSVESLSSSPSRYSDKLSILVAAAPLNNNNGQDQRLPTEANVICNLFESNTAIHMLGKDNGIDGLQEQAQGKTILHFPNYIAIAAGNPFHSRLSVMHDDQHPNSVTANTLFDLALPNDLAILSKTSVADKDSKGQAVRMFYSGLQYAGVRNVMMSLWIEPETPRIDELVDFYRNKQKGLSQAQSLRQAQLIAMSKDPSVRSWAAFQLIGPGN